MGVNPARISGVSELTYYPYSYQTFLDVESVVEEGGGMIDGVVAKHREGMRVSV